MADPSHTAALVLPADPGSVGESRRWLVRFLDERMVDRSFIDDAVLVISELVTNALRHGDGDLVCHVSINGGRECCLAVIDAADELPAVMPPEPGRIGGLGLVIVDRLATKWGVAGFAGGKAVWATMPTGSADRVPETMPSY